jgi:Galactosyltransferase
MKILVGICTCRKFVYAAGDSVGHKESPDNPRIQAVLDTWHPKSVGKVDVKLFVGNGPERINLPDLVELDTPDSYYELPAKVKAMFKWALDAGYDYLLKCDDDVYVRCPNLLKFFQPVDYCGYQLESNTLTWGSGAAYVVSRRAMQLVGDTPWNPTWNSAEDQMVGRILAANGIPLTHDPRYLCCHCDTCFQKYGLNNLITVHTRNPQQMYDLHAKLG